MKRNISRIPRRIVAVVVSMCAIASATVVEAQTRFDSVRLNCGGPRFIDPDTGIFWKGDKSIYVTKGYRNSKCQDKEMIFANTTKSMRQIYCSHRFFKPSTVLQPYFYTIPVLNTTESYTVRLHFADTVYRAANTRTMDVWIEGELHLNDLDIVATSGFQSAFVYQAPNPIVVNDGVLTVQFIPVKRNAIISGIEVLLAPPMLTKSPAPSPTIFQPTSIPIGKLTIAPSPLKPTDTGKPNQTLTTSPAVIRRTNAPTKEPTFRPTLVTTNFPAKIPTRNPAKALPTISPTIAPTAIPSKFSTVAPITTTPFVYFSTNDTGTLGVPDVNIAIGNPLKGLAGGPRWSQQSPLPNSVPSAIEFYNMALDEIMIGDNEFNWTLHDQFLNESAGRKMHAVISVYIHWPGRPLRLPLHLKNLPLFNTSWSGQSPNYGDARLLDALRQFIFAWSEQIDGDTRIAALHAGLLGFWGEGHTYPDSTLVPESSKVAVAQWFRDAFNKTQVQARYPGSNAVGFGLFDGSLAYNTLDGASNGGKKVGWFQYPRMIEHGQTNIWKQQMMGGETRPELQEIVFTDTYPARTENHQDYKECVDALHMSYAVHHSAFQNGGYTGNTLRNANKIHAYMGYAFYVSEVAAATSTITNAQVVDVSISITQLGVAPFYYDLSLMLQCGNGLLQASLPGVNEIIGKGESKKFLFENVPATVACLGQINLSLQSSYMFPGRPILFAQGTRGDVAVSIPLPSESSSFTAKLPSFFSSNIFDWMKLFVN